MLKSLLESGHILASCPITVAEVHAGMRKHEETPTQSLLDSLHYLPITREVAAAAGGLRRHCRARGKQLSLADTMLAAVAIDYDCILVTANSKDFPMPEVRLMKSGE